MDILTILVIIEAHIKFFVLSVLKSILLIKMGKNLF